MSAVEDLTHATNALLGKASSAFQSLFSWGRIFDSVPEAMEVVSEGDYFGVYFHDEEDGEANSYVRLHKVVNSSAVALDKYLTGDALQMIQALVAEDRVASDEAKQATAADRAQTTVDSAVAQQAAIDARAAANATGAIDIQPTYAAALAKLPTYPAGAIVEIITDEHAASPNTGARTRYRVEGGALVFKVNMDQWRLDLAAADGSKHVTYKRPGPGTRARTSEDKLSDIFSLADCPGVVGDGVFDCTDGLQAAFEQVAEHGRNLLPDGKFMVKRPIRIKIGYQEIDWQGQLVAAPDFVGDYLVYFEFAGYKPSMRLPIFIQRMSLDCSFVTRGIYAYGMDHFMWYGLRVENALGQALTMDRSREGAIFGAEFINCAHRDAFPNPAYWTTSAAYTPGQRVRIAGLAWSLESSFTKSDIINSGGFKYIALEDNTGEDPAISTKWKRIPHEDYLCVKANTNKNPKDMNTNAAAVADRVWQKVYQDEAIVEIVDNVIDGGDRTNQITFYSPIVRDSGNKCYFRCDTSKVPFRPLTHLSIVCGHIHGLPSNQVNPGPIVIPDLQRAIEVGYAANLNIYGTNIRCGDSAHCIAVMVGDSGSTKLAQNIRLDKSVMSGDGERSIGLLVMPSAQPHNSTALQSSFVMGHATSTEMFDPRRVFRNTWNTEHRIRLPPSLNGVTGGYTVSSAYAYPDARPYGFGFDFEASTRFDIRLTSLYSQLRLSAGDGDYATVSYTLANKRLFLGEGKTVQITGTWQNPLIIGTGRLWWNGTTLMAKNGTDPTSISDGRAFQFQP